MVNRLLALIALFVVASVGETEVEPAHVNAALSEDDQCGLGAAGCALEALQTKVVRGVVDAAEDDAWAPDDASAPEMEVIDGNVETREEDAKVRELKDVAKDDALAPEMEVIDGNVETNEEDAKVRELEDVAKWYEESAAETRAVDEIVGTQEEFDTYALETMAVVPEDDPCRSGVVGRFRAVSEKCFDACPQMCTPLAEAVMAFFRRGGAPAVRKVICENQQKFYCPMLYVNQPDCLTFVERARGMHIELPTTIPAFQEQCRKILR